MKAEEIHQLVQDVAQEHLPLQADGYKSSTAMLYAVLFKAATERISIDAACNDLTGTVGGNTVRELINQQLSVTRLRQHEDEINAALCARMPSQIRKKPLEAAVDEHDEPFYGKNIDLRAYAVRSKPKKGTSYFFRIISLYVIYRQMRLTVAVAFVLPEDNTVEILDRLYQRTKALSLRLSVLYMDRGYCSGNVIRYLREQKQPAVIACTIRGKQGGTRQLCQGRESYRTTYTFTDGTTADMAVVATLTPDKFKNRHRKWLLYVVIELDWTPQRVYQRYRRRFGIETSYRILRCIRIKTSSRNAALRFFILGFALLLENLWAFLRWTLARIPGPGPHRVKPKHFQLQAFVCMLRRVVEHIWGCQMSVPYLIAAKS
jgi:putative transposase